MLFAAAAKSRGVLLCLLILLLSPSLFAANTEKPLQVVVISNDFVLPGKVRTLDALSQEQNVRFSHLPLSKAAKQPLVADLILLRKCRRSLANISKKPIRLG